MFLRFSSQAVGTNPELSGKPENSPTVLFSVKMRWGTSGESHLQNRWEALALRATPGTSGFAVQQRMMKRCLEQEFSRQDSFPGLLHP